ncbi:hypothetical protein B0T26DRAFT_755255 [Lasiosphaeria miniovina]|uniref:Uncharacterized protein n=1 Tax=Lasiosphaeria miniovina TaxID=1954250 RepID=A0AA40A6J2_9PEZI|nr:uncharacterized protein B0T26DRAFT_755255 [Lasiosphaeria miniovina]KAK0710145.1 hypothetical protein B0T26DRAFT_755255 [Lasiosphaeria miniovina]
MLPQIIQDERDTRGSGLLALDPLYESIVLPRGEGIRSIMLPGVRCPTCAAKGEEVWVIPGRACGYCRTPAPSEHDVSPEDIHFDHSH